MGVSGSGKSSFARALSERKNISYFDADDFHSESNITKLKNSIPLTDSDRIPWLNDLNAFLLDKKLADSVILACSALKENYRKKLLENIESYLLVYLKGDYDLIFKRMKSRDMHFMKSDLLKSQFDDLEEPNDAIVLNIENTIEQMVFDFEKQISN